MKFVDEARLKVQAGNGGRGSASFRREKFVPFGGPDGGDGGHGGSIYLRAASGINTLADFRIERTFRAANGEPGGANDCSGRSGADLYVPVPLGTVGRDADTHEELGDLTREGEELLVARGGTGGGGKQRFKSRTNRSPRQFGPGLRREKRALTLELQPIARLDPHAGPGRDARAIVRELKKFSKELSARPRWLVLNKRDLLPPEEAERRARAIVRALRYTGPRFLISGATGEGTKALCEAV